MSPAGGFWIGLLLPIAGVILGILKAFDPDPEQKRVAGYGFTGALAGVAAWVFFFSTVAPIIGGGIGGPAYERGVAAMSEGNLMKAEAAFREAITIDPGYAAAWVSLAAAQARQDNPFGA
ncbi:MAG TPA: tetratricopeptide repeat protein, partial [Armatimonadota bacterium]|nr:tetratricopeptide repeat protein [Armatimonadota bacterium]